MITYIGFGILAIGIFFFTTSLIGMFRFPDFYSKIHASSISDSFAIPVSLIGLSCISDNYLLSIKFLLIAILYLIISPASSNALVKAFYNSTNNKESDK
jgi:multicomponent Na+:H+ antiporter subunit G